MLSVSVLRRKSDAELSVRGYSVHAVVKPFDKNDESQCIIFEVPFGGPCLGTFHLRAPFEKALQVAEAALLAFAGEPRTTAVSNGVARVEG